VPPHSHTGFRAKGPSLQRGRLENVSCAAAAQHSGRRRPPASSREDCAQPGGAQVDKWFGRQGRASRTKCSRLWPPARFRPPRVSWRRSRDFKSVNTTLLSEHALETISRLPAAGLRLLQTSWHTSEAMRAVNTGAPALTPAPSLTSLNVLQVRRARAVNGGGAACQGAAPCRIPSRDDDAHLSLLWPARRRERCSNAECQSAWPEHALQGDGDGDSAVCVRAAASAAPSRPWNAARVPETS
jgi:hypothetical protein